MLNPSRARKSYKLRLGREHERGVLSFGPMQVSVLSLHTPIPSPSYVAHVLLKLCTSLSSIHHAVTTRTIRIRGPRYGLGFHSTARSSVKAQ